VFILPPRPIHHQIYSLLGNQLIRRFISVDPICFIPQQFHINTERNKTTENKTVLQLA